MSVGAINFCGSVTFERIGEDEVRIERRYGAGPIETEIVTLAGAMTRGFDLYGPWPPPHREPVTVTSVDRERGVITVGGGE